MGKKLDTKTKIVVSLLLLAGFIYSILLFKPSLIILMSLIVGVILRKKETAYLAVIYYVMYVLGTLFGIISGGSIIGYLFYGFIVYLFYTEWLSHEDFLGNVIIRDLHHDESMYYANLFLVLLGLNIFFLLLFSGFNLAVLSIEIIIIFILDSMRFLAIYMFARRIFEASYFYIGYLCLNLIVFVIFSFQVQSFIFFIIETLILLGLMLVFIKENKA